MLAAGIGAADASDMLRGIEDVVSIAAVNSPTALTFSGDRSALQKLHTKLEAQGCFARTLQVEVPYHSPHMDSLRDELIASLAAVRPGAASCRYYSTIDV